MAWSWFNEKCLSAPAHVCGTQPAPLPAIRTDVDPRSTGRQDGTYKEGLSVGMNIGAVCEVARDHAGSLVPHYECSPDGRRSATQYLLSKSRELANQISSRKDAISCAPDSNADLRFLG
jgi:hypothetical protein